MNPKNHNIGYWLSTENNAYQGAGLSAGAATAGSAINLSEQESFVLLAQFAGTTGTPTTATVTFALESSADGSTGWHTCNDRDGNPITLAVTAAEAIDSVNVDTQYFTKGDQYLRVTPTVAFTGGTAPTAYFTAALIKSSQERM